MDTGTNNITSTTDQELQALAHEIEKTRQEFEKTIPGKISALEKEVETLLTQ
jgi:hypothetical protein